MLIDGKSVKIGDCFKNWDFVDLIDDKVLTKQKLLPNSKYFYTKDEIFEMYKDILTKEQIKELYKN